MNPSTAAPAAAAPAASAATTDLREFLAFRLGADEYGIDMLRVHEIRSYERPSRVADAPAFVKGVINLRGVIVPIVDLRVRLQLQVAQYDALTVVIVLQVGSRVMGVVVDAVSEVIALQPDQLRPAGPASEHQLAIGAVGERLLILVDIDKLIGGADIGGGPRTLQ